MSVRALVRWCLASAVLVLASLPARAAPDAARLSRLGLEPDTDRPGEDYRQLRMSDPVDCFHACRGAQECAAFTHQGNVCYLKRAVPEAQGRPGFVSGVVRRGEAGPSRPVVSRGAPGVSAAVSTTRAASASRGAPVPSMPEVWHDLSASDADFLRVTDRGDVLGTGEEGTLSAWVRASWDDAWCQAEQQRIGPDQVVRMYLYDHGTTQRARLRIALSCDRRRVLLEQVSATGGYVWDEVYLPAKGLSDGEPHQLHFRVDAKGTEIWMDDVFAGALGVTFQEAPSAPLAVGAMNSGAFRLPGQIARLRVFDVALDEDRILLLGGLDDRAVQRQPEWASVVGWMDTSEGDARLRLKEAAWDPATLAHHKPWLLSGEEGRTQLRTDEQSETDLTFAPHPMHALFWSDVCELPRAAPSPGRVPCGEQVLVMATITHTRDDQQLRYRLFERTSPESFQQLGGSLTLRTGPRKDAMRVGDEIYVLPRAQDQTEDYGGAWVGGGGVNMDFASKGFHLERMDPFDVTRTGTEGFVFGMNVAYMNQYRSRAWRQEARATLPWGLWIDHTTIGCDGSRTLDMVSSEQELAETASSNWGVTVMNFSVNRNFQEMSSRMSRESTTTISSQARCTNFVLILDRPRAELTHGFRDAVWNAAEACTERGGCEAALQQLVDRFGTHYPNAIGYGGVAEMLTELSETETRVIDSIEQATGTSFQQTINTSATVGTGSSMPISASVTVGTSFTNGFSFQEMDRNSTSQAMKSLQERMQYRSRGGRGGATFEAWSSDESSAIPIYADIRPIHELLAPPFFTDRRVLDVVRPELVAYLQRRLQATALKSEQFNTQRPMRISGLEYDTERVGASYKTLSGHSVVDCQNLCKRDSGCLAFAWSERGAGLCALKKVQTRPVSKPGWISASVRDSLPTVRTPTPEARPRRTSWSSGRWTGYVSEETGPATCPSRHVVVGVGCKGRYCDDVRLYCAQASYGLTDTNTWSGWYSEEGGRNTFQAPSGHVVTSIRCRGDYCDDVRFEYARVDGELRACQWSSGKVSEEMGSLMAARSQWVAGVKCSGRYCDDKALLLCEVHAK